MSAQTTLFGAVIDEVNDSLNLFGKVEVGQLKPQGGISAEIEAGYADATYMDKGTLQVMPVLLLSKHKVQKQAADALFEICNYLSRKTEYSSGIDWEITTIRTATTPNFVDKEQSGGCYIYSAIVNIEFYLRGVN